jgi:hypothetical protein
MRLVKALVRNVKPGVADHVGTPPRPVDHT